MIGWLRRRPAPPETPRLNDPFAVLGLARDVSLTDDDVRIAWRRIAAATHPDRADGGDPGRFAAAAAAYTDLRTSYGRGEARAALALPPRTASARASWQLGTDAVLSRVRTGRPARLTVRVAGTAAAAVIAVLAAGPGPAGPALAVGAATWLALTIRNDRA
jgi:curved DNA-binding protein CbpA